MARTPVLPEATPVGALSALLRHFVRALVLGVDLWHFLRLASPLRNETESEPHVLARLMGSLGPHAAAQERGRPHAGAQRRVGPHA